MRQNPKPVAPEKRIRAYFFAAGAGFMPLLGLIGSIPVAIASFRAPRERRSLLVLSLVSLSLNLALIGYFYGAWRSYHEIIEARPLRKSEVSRAEQNLHSIMRTLEYAKASRGEYPYTLQELEEWIPSVYFADLWDPSTRPGCYRSYPFYTRSRDGQNYQLFGLGPDCTPHTEDDVHIPLSGEELSNVGLLPRSQSPANKGFQLTPAS